MSSLILAFDSLSPEKQIALMVGPLLAAICCLFFTLDAAVALLFALACGFIHALWILSASMRYREPVPMGGSWLLARATEALFMLVVFALAVIAVNVVTAVGRGDGGGVAELFHSSLLQLAGATYLVSLGLLAIATAGLLSRACRSSERTMAFGVFLILLITPVPGVIFLRKASARLHGSDASGPSHPSG